jgi:hypothetical protein
VCRKKTVRRSCNLWTALAAGKSQNETLTGLCDTEFFPTLKMDRSRSAHRGCAPLDTYMLPSHL